MVDKDKQMAQTSILEAMMMFKKPFRLDQNQKGGGILIYVSSNIPTKFLTKHSFPNDIDQLFVEINFRKSKWLPFRTSPTLTK